MTDRNENVEKDMELNLSMFKAYDIRTRSEKLTEPMMVRLVQAVGRYFVDIIGTDSVVLGRDARLAAPALMETVIEILPRMGLSVIVNPLQESTCQFYFSCLQNPSSGGIMITASHNPGEYIGLKLMAPGVRTLAMGSGPAGGISAIKDFYIEDKTCKVSPKRGSVSVKRYLDHFIDYSLELAGVGQDSLAGVPVLADFLNGAAGTEISEALGYAGASLHVRNIVPNGFFPVGAPNPIIISSIQPTWDLMARGEYAFGFCFDGDGDRMDIMDSRGGQLAPAFNMTVLLPEIKRIFEKAHASGFFTGGKEAPWAPHMYADVKANPLSMHDQVLCGMGVHIIRNGHSFIKEALRLHCKEQYLVASEESAHYYMNFPYDLEDYSKGFAATENTLFFTLLTSKLWAAAPQAYESAIRRQAGIFREREWPCVFYDDEHMEQVMLDVEHAFTSSDVIVIKDMEDGSSLDATLMRKGLPEVITRDTDMSEPWVQVAQRISRSEERMTRWEIVSNKEELCREALSTVRKVTDRYVEAGYATYDEV